MGFNERKQETLAFACLRSISGLLWTTLGNGRPADKTLKNFFKRNKKYGSRDRRVISETYFGVLRWWGWIAPLSPKKFRDMLSEKQSETRKDKNSDFVPDEIFVIPYKTWSRLLVAASVLERRELGSIAKIWANQCKVSHAELERDLQSKYPESSIIKSLWKKHEGEAPKAENQNLIPNWALDEVNLKENHYEKLYEWLQVRPPVWLRINPGKVEEVLAELNENELEPEVHKRLTNAVKITVPRVNLRNLETFVNGSFEVQDVASQLIGNVCGAKPGEQWWDCCAGAGGKTLQIAADMHSKGKVVSSDIRAHKLEDLKKRARRSGISNIQCKSWNGTKCPVNYQFDGVLVDAPCTCSGTWRRNPDARWSTTRDEIDEISKVQSNILKSAAPKVKEGGILVYATCSMFYRENMGVVKQFLKNNPEFELEPFRCELTGRLSNGTVQIWPWDADCDAMFVARFRRK